MTYIFLVTTFPPSKWTPFDLFFIILVLFICLDHIDQLSTWWIWKEWAHRRVGIVWRTDRGFSIPDQHFLAYSHSVGCSWLILTCVLAAHVSCNITFNLYCNSMKWELLSPLFSWWEKPKLRSFFSHGSRGGGWQMFPIKYQKVNIFGFWGWHSLCTDCSALPLQH